MKVPETFSDPHFLLQGHSEMALRISKFPWANTPLGPIEHWDPTLKVMTQTILNSAQAHVIMWGADRTCVYNDAFIPILGSLKHPISLGAGVRELWSENWPRLQPFIDEAAKGISNIVPDFSFEIERDGKISEGFFSVCNIPLYDYAGNISGILTSANETTVMILSMRENIIIKEKIVTVLERMNDAYFSLDKNWTIMGVNHSHELASKLTRDQQIGKNFIELFFSDPELQNTKYMTAYRKVMEEREAVSFEDYYPPLDLWTMVNAFPIDDGGIAVIFKDINDIKKKEKRLMQIQTELENVIEIAQIGFWQIVFPSQKFSVTPTFLRQMGLPVDLTDVSLKECIEQVYLEDRDKLNRSIEEAISRNGSFHIEYRVVLPSGEIRWIESKGSVITDEKNQPVKFSGTTLDVTDRALTRQGLEDAKLEAERSNRLKTAFLANMSHEIRTPLGAMMGFAELLGEPGISETDRANYIEILKKNGEQLGLVINDILDLSKVETDQITFEYMKVKPLQIAQEVVSLMSVIANEKKLELSIEDDGSAPPEIATDPTRTKQVLMNLVNNALKFTKAGSIKIKLTGYWENSGEKCCAFEIIDTGIGIPPESKEVLFKMFSQGDNSMTRTYGGTGLGLALSRSLARAMGGNVRLIKSEVGVGSTFRFTIQSREDLMPKIDKSLGIQQNEVTQKIQPDELKGMQILLVEDSPDNQELIKQYLERYGAHVEIAENGEEGVTKALANGFDIVLMDLQMPVMDGYSATAKLREKNFRIPIVALTAHAMADVKDKCEEVGFTTHLPKPIDWRQLVTTVKLYAYRH